MLSRVHNLMKRLMVLVHKINPLIWSAAFSFSHQCTIVIISNPMILLMFSPLLQIFSPLPCWTWGTGSPLWSLFLQKGENSTTEGGASQIQGLNHSRAGRTSGLLMRSRDGGPTDWETKCLWRGALQLSLERFGMVVCTSVVISPLITL